MLADYEALSEPRGYPNVVGEYQTIVKLLAGYSIARIGDGELKLMCGGGISREPTAPAGLTAELIAAAHFPHPMCVPGIWTYDLRGPKYMGMLRHRARFLSVLSPHVEYYSSFISRPDCAPWIMSRTYADLVERLWAGKKVAVVCQRKGSIWAPVRRAARSMVHVECPTHGAYGMIDELEDEVVTARPDIAILSAGATATCLANRLARRGVHAIDFGSAGKFLNELLSADA